MSATVYLDRDNDFTLTLTADGSAPTADSITKAALWIPGQAFSDDTPKVIDTDGEEMTLTDSATKVDVSLGALNINRGSHYCYLTVYDAVNTNGIAWDSVLINVTEWPAEV